MENLSNKSKSLRCMVVGDDRTGKTSMIAAFAMGSILEERVPTTFGAFNVCDSYGKFNFEDPFNCFSREDDDA